MGTLLNGINGPFKGRVGDVVGYMWKKKAVIRSLPGKMKKPLSPLQIQQHAKFALMNHFMNRAKSLLNITYGHLVENMTGFNKAFSYNVKNAIAGNHPDLKIDYSRVLLGRGDLTNVSTAGAKSSSEGMLEFSWTDNSGTGSAKSTDQVFAAIYSEEKNTCIYGLNIASRDAGKTAIVITRLKGKEVQAYIGFMSEDGKDATDTSYLGSVQL